MLFVNILISRGRKDLKFISGMSNYIGGDIVGWLRRVNRLRILTYIGEARAMGALLELPGCL